MIEIIELWNSTDSDKLYYRCGDRFSATRSAPQKNSETSLYGEGYYYRNIAKEFGISEDNDLKVVTKNGEVIWSG